MGNYQASIDLMADMIELRDGPWREHYLRVAGEIGFFT